jgi:hypothetical protein
MNENKGKQELVAIAEQELFYFSACYLTNAGHILQCYTKEPDFYFLVCRLSMSNRRCDAFVFVATRFYLMNFLQ